jgi:hypothetical protein
MAKVTLNPILDDIRGKIGDYVLRRAPSGKLILSKAPDMSRVKWSKTQKENRQRFKEATAYAKAAMAEPEVRARYEKRATEEGKRPYNLALSDYLKGRNLLSGSK